MKDQIKAARGLTSEDLIGAFSGELAGGQREKNLCQQETGKLSFAFFFDEAMDDIIFLRCDRDLDGFKCWGHDLCFII